MIPDINIILKYFELINNFSSNIILCRTLFLYITKSSTLRQLNRLIKTNGKSVIVFENEFGIETYVQRKNGETNEQRHQRGNEYFHSKIYIKLWILCIHIISNYFSYFYFY
jgi:hypothetical protein